MSVSRNNLSFLELSKPFGNRINDNFLVSILFNHIVLYPSPTNISYMWSFGMLAGLALVIQIISGVFLAMHYAPEISHAFLSVEHIMRDVPNGYLLRYVHANGASMFFLIVYIHMFRGLYYGSYASPRQHLWLSGCLIFVIMMATGFMGYVLPWGQMSLWGATVITNLFSALPKIGTGLVQWIWGGFAVDNPTLNRIFSLHFILPVVIAALAVIHIALLHVSGSNNPVGSDSKSDKANFYPYFYIKDLFALMLFIYVFSIFVLLFPNYLGHPDNYIEGNALVTPPHIVPEWYFLPYYAILRSIPDKLGGVVAMALSLGCFFFVPFLDMSKIRSMYFKPIQRPNFWILFGAFILLGWIGQKVVETPFVEIGRGLTIYYFLYFFFLFPLFGEIENNLAIQQMGNIEKKNPSQNLVEGVGLLY